MVKITFVSPEGDQRALETAGGETLMKFAGDNGVEGMAGECGGSMSCGTCHVYLDDATYDRLGPPRPTEDDMLDIVSAERRPTSRLSCQIKIDENLDGSVITIPESQF